MSYCYQKSKGEVKKRGTITTRWNGRPADWYGRAGAGGSRAGRAQERAESVCGAGRRRPTPPRRRAGGGGEVIHRGATDSKSVGEETRAKGGRKQCLERVLNCGVSEQRSRLPSSRRPSPCSTRMVTAPSQRRSWALSCARSARTRPRLSFKT